MATLREIKKRISSVESTRQITKAMKMVAAAKLRKAQERMHQTRPYAAKIRELMHSLLPKVDIHEQPLVLPRTDIENVLVVVVTSDRGLCGAFNANVLRRAAGLVAELSVRYEVEVYPVGRKAYDYFRKRDYQLFGHKTQFFNELHYSHAEEIAESLSGAYLRERFDQVHIVFNEFRSVIQQNLKVEQFLPIELPAAETEATEEKTLKSLVEPLYEPDKKMLLDQLIPKSLIIHIWRVLVESSAAEEGARMAAMDSATENATELINTLRLKYNRTRQAAITTEIAEIVGGAEALKGQ